MRRYVSLGGCAFFVVALILLTAAPAEGMTKAQLRAKAHSLSNLPTGWSVDNSSSSGGDVTGGCLAGMKKPPAKKGEVKVNVQYQDGQLPDLNELLATGTGSLSQYNHLNHVLAGCKTFTESENGQTLMATVGAMSFPKVGDASSAYEVTLSAQGISAGADFVLFRVGTIVGVLEYADFGQPDSDQLQRFVTEAVRKVEGKPVATPTTI